MADIQLRFNKDVLTLSTTLRSFFAEHDFNIASELDYVVLCEPELLEEEYRLESVIHTPVFVAPTNAITATRLAHERFEGRAVDLAGAAYAQAAAFKPQHIIAAVSPTELPLDESSQVSLKQNKTQYQTAVEALALQPYDGLYFTNFSNGYDAQCALMGARAVYDGPLFISFDVTAQGFLLSGSHALSDAVVLADEYGADVIGISSGERLEVLLELVALVRNATNKPLLVEVQTGLHERNLLSLPEDNPYYAPETLVDVALSLQQAGVQFMRAGGYAVPAYTAVLNATVDGLDVISDQ